MSNKTLMSGPAVDVIVGRWVVGAFGSVAHFFETDGVEVHSLCGLGKPQKVMFVRGNWPKCKKCLRKHHEGNR